MRKLESKERKWWLALAFLASCVAALWLAGHIQIEPHGKFREDNLSYTGASYYEFKNGRVYIVLSGASTKDCGNYSKQGSRWIWVTIDGSSNLVESTIFGVRITTSDDMWSKWFPRMFIDR